MDNNDNDNDDIPELAPIGLTPPVRNQADLHRQWRALMGRLGFGSTSLWFMFLEGDGRVTPYICQIEDLPELPDREGTEGLMQTLRSVMEAELDDDASVAFLRTRPGSARLTRFDTLWAEKLLGCAHETGIPCWPVHLATDEALVVIADDDLHPAQTA